MANETAGDRTNVIELDIESQAHAAVAVACDRLRLRSYDRARNVYRVMCDFITGKELGFNEAEVRAVVLALDSLVSTLYGGCEQTDDAVAKRLELEAELQEQHADEMLFIAGESATLLEEHGHALVKDASASLTLARARFRRARQIRTDRSTARARVGLNGAA